MQLSPLTPEIARAKRDGMSGRELARIVRGVDLEFDPPEFNILADAPLTALFIRTGETIPNTDDGAPIIKGTTSSTDTDLYGSRMMPQAIESMRRGALGLTTFLNHDYAIPESILGGITSAETTRRKGPDGKMYNDLDLTTTVVGEDVNPRALACWRGIRGGVKLGFSIGAMVLQWEWQLPDGTPLETDTSDEWEMYCPPTDDAVLAYLDVMLLESSLVGVPANRRSWVSNATRAMVKAGRAWQSAQKRKYGGLALPTRAVRLEELPMQRTATDADKAAQEARSKKYGIGIKDDTNVTKPGEFSDVPDSQYGDPVNYAYPMPDKAHADNVASRWGDKANRDQYSAAEQEIIGKRIEDRQKDFGETPDKEDAVEPEIIATVDDAANPNLPAVVADLDPFALLVRAANLVVQRAGTEISKENSVNLCMAHDAISHTMNMSCCGMEGCAGHSGDTDYSGRSANPDANPAPNPNDPSESGAGENQPDADTNRSITPDMLRTVQQEWAAGQHILASLRAEIQATRLDMDLLKAEANLVRAFVTDAQSIGGGRPTHRNGDASAALTYDDRYAQASADVPVGSAY